MDPVIQASLNQGKVGRGLAAPDVACWRPSHSAYDRIPAHTGCS